MVEKAACVDDDDNENGSVLHNFSLLVVLLLFKGLWK